MDGAKGAKMSVVLLAQFAPAQMKASGLTA